MKQHQHHFRQFELRKKELQKFCNCAEKNIQAQKKQHTHRKGAGSPAILG